MLQSPKKAIGLSAALLTLTACGTNDELSSYLTSIETATAQVSLNDIYNDQWSEFAVVCPYTPSDYAKAELDVGDTPWPDKWPDEQTNFLLLKSDTGEYKWVRYRRSNLDFCSEPRIDFTIFPTAATLEFTANDGWILESVHP